MSPKIGPTVSYEVDPKTAGTSYARGTWAVTWRDEQGAEHVEHFRTDREAKERAKIIRVNRKAARERARRAEILKGYR